MRAVGDLGSWREGYSRGLTEMPREAQGGALDPRKEGLPPYCTGVLSSDKGLSSELGFPGISSGLRGAHNLWLLGQGPGLALSHRQASPVDDVEGVQVANGAGHLGSIEPGPGLQEPALPLQVEEELEGEDTCERVSWGEGGRGRVQVPECRGQLAKSPPL